MNERDYSLLQYISLVTGIVLITAWISFSIFHNIAFTAINLIFLLITGIFTFGISLVAYFKKQIWLAEMRNGGDKDR